MRVITTYNTLHLGDQFFVINLFNKIAPALDQIDAIIIHHMQRDYIEQIQQFIKSERIFLRPLTRKGINVCVVDKKYINSGPRRWQELLAGTIGFNDLLVDFYNEICLTLQVPACIDKFEYWDDDLETRYAALPDKYKDLDILFINSKPFANQYPLFDDELSRRINDIKTLSTRFKTAVTLHVESINCTMDDKLTIKDIAAAATRAKYIVAVNTGVVPGCLNTLALKNVKHWWIVDIQLSWNYPNFTWVKQWPKIDEIIQEIDK